MSPNLSPETKQFVPESPDVAPQKPQQEVEPKTVERHEQEKPASRQEQVEESVYGKITAPQAVTRDTQPQTIGEKPQSLVRVELILEEHIADLFKRLPEQDKPLFKEKGEQTAREINSLLGQAKIQVKKIFGLIVDWLTMIPGINKFFIEQQAEIKTNKLLEIKDKQQ